MFSQWTKNTNKLTLFIIRREFVFSLIWLICMVFITLIVPVAYSEMYANQAERNAIAESMKNPAMIAMIGPVYSEDNYTMSVMFSNEMLLFSAIAMGIMNIFLVVRNTRRDEEQGRIEIIRSLPTGRLSNLCSILSYSVILNAVFAVLITIGLTVLNIESFDFAGSSLYGVTLGVIGLFFAAVTAFFAQISSNSRNVTAYTFAFMGFSYILRAIGDIYNDFISKITPLGLILRTNVYAENYWFPIVIVLILTLILVFISLYLNSVRNMDQGFIAAKSGKKSASKSLLSSFGLTWRLLRNTIFSWIFGLFILGALYGSVMGELELFLGENELLMNMFPKDSGFTITELFISMLLSVISISSAIPCISIILKLYSEEKNNRIEHLLARNVSKYEILFNYFILSLLSSFVIQLVSVFGLWSASYIVLETPILFMSLFKAMMVYLPAIWIMIGITVFLVGIFPQFSGFSWFYLGYSFFIIYIGRIINLPKWLEKLCPFGYIPKLPLDEINYYTLLILTLISMFLMIFGFIFYRKRDMKN